MVVLDHRPLVAEGVASLLRDFFEVDAVATSREAFARCLLTARPDVVVVGIGMGDDGGRARALLDVAVKSSGRYRVVGMVGRTDIEAMTDVLTAGVSSVVSTSASRTELQQAVIDAMSGSAVMTPAEMATIMVQLRGTRQPEEPNLPSLSPRETEILGALVNGWSTARIAETLGISTNTVRTHIQNMLGKLGVHSKLEATAAAARLGLVTEAPDLPGASPSNVSPLRRRDWNS